MKLDKDLLVQTVESTQGHKTTVQASEDSSSLNSADVLDVDLSEGIASAKRRWHDASTTQHDFNFDSPSGIHEATQNPIVPERRFSNPEVQAIHEDVVRAWNKDRVYREGLIQRALSIVTDDAYKKEGFIPKSMVIVEVDFLKAVIERRDGTKPFVPTFGWNSEREAGWKSLHAYWTQAYPNSDFCHVEIGPEQWAKALRSIEAVDLDESSLPKAGRFFLSELRDFRRIFRDRQRQYNQALHGVATALRTMVVRRLLKSVDKPYARERFAVILHGGCGSGKGWAARLLREGEGVSQLPSEARDTLKNVENPIWLVIDEAGESGGGYLYPFISYLDEYALSGICLYTDCDPLIAVVGRNFGILRRALRFHKRITNIAHLPPKPLKEIFDLACTARNAVLNNTLDSEQALDVARKEMSERLRTISANHFGQGDLGYGYLWCLRNFRSVQQRRPSHVHMLAVTMDYVNETGMLPIDDLENLPSANTFAQKAKGNGDLSFSDSAIQQQLRDFEVEAIIEFLLYRDDAGCFRVIEEALEYKEPIRSPLIWAALGACPTDDVS